MTMNVKFRWSYALYLVFILSVFLLNIFVFEHSNLLKLSINTLFALGFLFLTYPMELKGNWSGFTKGAIIFLIAYPLFWYICSGQFSLKEEKHFFVAIILVALCFRPPNSSWHSALKCTGLLFSLNGFFDLGKSYPNL